MTAQTKKNSAANIWLLIGVIVVGIVVLEVVSGILLDNKSLEAKKKILSAMLDNTSTLPAAINFRSDDRLSPHPYTLYRTTPNYSFAQKSEGGEILQQHNSLGYRSDEFLPKKPPGVFRVLALGGSTTYGVVPQKYQNTWPYLLQEILNRELPDNYNKIEVVNGGASGYTSAEILSSWMFKHQYIEADLVIIHTGGNDVYPLLYPDYDPEYLHFRARGISYVLPMQDVLKRIVALSNTIELLSLSLLPEGNLFPVYVSSPYPFADLNREETMQRVERTYPEGFARNIATLVRAIKSSGANAALISFVQASDDWIEEFSQDKQGLVPAFALALQKNRDAMRGIAIDQDIPYLEPTHSDIPDELFVDYCHLREDAHIVKAELFANFLIDEGLVPR